MYCEEEYMAMDSMQFAGEKNDLGLDANALFVFLFFLCGLLLYYFTCWFNKPHILAE